jgi:hypothetical protein
MSDPSHPWGPGGAEQPIGRLHEDALDSGQMPGTKGRAGYRPTTPRRVRVRRVPWRFRFAALFAIGTVYFIVQAVSSFGTKDNQLSPLVFGIFALICLGIAYLLVRRPRRTRMTPPPEQ